MNNIDYDYYWEIEQRCPHREYIDFPGCPHAACHYSFYGSAVLCGPQNCPRAKNRKTKTKRKTKAKTGRKKQ